MKTQTQGFLEVTIFDDESADIRDGSGVVDIGESDRVFVALALLGGITDELVERVVESLYALKRDCEGDNEIADLLGAFEIHDTARAVINAVFGIEP